MSTVFVRLGGYVEDYVEDYIKFLCRTLKKCFSYLKGVDP